jgi:nitrite reductase/ring-hydroxylating ferredoxin subunit
MLFARDGKVFAYYNACPHQGRAMNFAPDRFILSKEGQLVCPHHGATFEIGSGLCVAGPCKGSSLKAVTASVVDGEVMI